MILAALGFAGLAHAAPVTSLAVGWEGTVGRPWAGLEAALWADQAQGWAPAGRVVLGGNLGGPQPLIAVEAGAVRVVPAEGAVVRVGAAFRVLAIRSDMHMPTSLGETSWGLLPAGLAWLEFTWEEPVAFSLGVRAGPGSQRSTEWCLGEPSPACTTWHAGLVGGIYLRKRWDSGLAVELTGGSTANLSVGRAW